MNRIDAKFNALKNKGETAFMPFMVGGDPDFKASLKIAETLCKAGDLLEIGIPYSDPLADGPTIQLADMRALKSGANTDSIFRLVKGIRTKLDTPITALVYANMILKRGVDKFYKQAAKCGIDGIVVPDLPIEEAEDFQIAARKHGIRQIFLVAQTTDNPRLKKILKHAKGFLYLVSILGVTGVRKQFDTETLKFIKRVKSQTTLPLCVGFGISTPLQFEQMVNCGADGVIVGSAIVNIIEKNLGKKSLIPKLSAFTDKFK